MNQSSEIKPTPELKGKYAKAFLDSIKANQYDQSKAAYLAKCKRTYTLINQNPQQLLVIRPERNKPASSTL